MFKSHFHQPHFKITPYISLIKTKFPNKKARRAGAGRSFPRVTGRVLPSLLLAVSLAEKPRTP